MSDLDKLTAAIDQALRPIAESARRTVEQLLPFACPLCAQRTATAIGAKAHYTVDHSWWERAAWRVTDTWSMLRTALVDLFTTSIWLPWWVIAAAIVLAVIAAGIGQWTA